MKIIISILLTINLVNMNAQQTEFYSLNEALANATSAKSLYLNYNFSTIEPIDDSIERLTNLEEFRIMPRIIEFPKIEDNKIVSNKLDDSDTNSPTSLPESLINCTELKIIDISNTEIEHLPEGFEKLNQLEKLILNHSKLNIDKELSKILELKNIGELQIIGLEISPESLNMLTQKKELKVISNLEELKSNHQDNNTIDVQIHDSYFVFDNSDEADRFIHSMPDFLQSSVKIYRKND
ncbi:MAG TPA: hypothetical protein P5235_00215 [Saprospiraceae bacterium]|nr:hypothetical protein [Saprospiraceae bacterium]MCB9327614.1 hypothetical protein [Lewinellaceae bacterium]HRX27778.1 hypothetical protein [Saprospiraceae bacterium]